MTQARTLVELFESQLLSSSSASLIDGIEGLSSYTYGEAWALAAQIAHALSEHRVRPGDRVALQVSKTSEALIVYLACLRAGAVLVPLNPGATSDELEYLLGDAEATLVVADSTLAAARTTLPLLTLDTASGATLLEAAAGQPTSAPAFTTTPASVAAIVYTSGTTGRAKGAVMSHRNLTSNALTLAAVWGFERTDRLLHLLPIFHVHGLFVATNCAVASASTLVLGPRFDVEVVLEHLPASTVMMGVPTFYTRLLADHRFGTSTCRSARLIISGSAPLLATTHVEFEQRTGQVILERYGMSETSMLTSNPLHGKRKPGTVGPALPGVSVRVVDTLTNEPLAVDEIGEIQVTGPNVFSGYWNRPELNATEFTADGFFRTGDVGTIDADGYLTIVGRDKDLIITGGLNVYPKEIEEAIDALSGVAASAVIGIPDADFGEVVVAVVVGLAGATLVAQELRESLRVVLAAYKVPKAIHIVDALPQNAMGKVEKSKLRDAYA